MKKCMGCMRDYGEKILECPFCGYSPAQMLEGQRLMPEAIPPEIILFGRFIIGRVLSMTDFSVVYISWDALLQRRVVIREFFPLIWSKRAESSMEITFYSDEHRKIFEKGKEAFISEARALYLNQDIPEIIHLYRWFEENNTVYTVTEYVEGCTLRDIMDARGAEEVRTRAENAFEQLFGIVDKLRERGIVHYNLSPDNIYMDSEKRFRLLDFGMAKKKVMDLSKRKLEVLDIRYAAPEVFRDVKSCANADIYSLGAIYYYMLNGKEPPHSGKRIRISGRKGTKKQNTAIRLLTDLDPELRPVSLKQLYQRINLGR